MDNIQFCKRCLYGDTHPLGLVIDEEGICSGCRIHEEKDQLDWDARWKKLEEIVAPYRNTKQDNYDCIISFSFDFFYSLYINYINSYYIQI